MKTQMQKQTFSFLMQQMEVWLSKSFAGRMTEGLNLPGFGDKNFCCEPAKWGIAFASWQ